MYISFFFLFFFLLFVCFTIYRTGGNIDSGHHYGRAKLALYETLAFQDAIAKGDELTNENDTLIVVTADHSHTLSISGYPSRGNPILGICALTRPN